MDNMPVRGNFPKPSLNWGKSSIDAGIKDVAKRNGKEKVVDWAKSQTPAGNVVGEHLKVGSHNIILDSNILNSFLKRLGEHVRH